MKSFIMTIPAGMLILAVITGCGMTANRSIPNQEANNAIGATSSASEGVPSRNQVKTQQLSESADIEWNVEGDTQRARATLYKSSNQPFALYVLPNYQASAEEPGKDVVVFGLNPKAWMRIEALPPGTSSQDAIANVKLRLSAIGSVDKVSHTAKGSILQQAAFYHASDKTSSVTGITFQRNGRPYIATITVPREFESTAPFYAMLETLQNMT